jgi:hypothetical protein
LPLLGETGRAMAGQPAYEGRLVKLAQDYDVNMTMRDDWLRWPPATHGFRRGRLRCRGPRGDHRRLFDGKHDTE